MKPVRAIAFLMLGLSVTACASVESVTRNAPYEQVPNQAARRGRRG